MTNKEFAFAETIKELADKISPLLAGQPREIQGAVLGQLVAIWLAGHYANDPEEQMDLWTGLLFQQAKLSLRLAANDRQQKRAG